MSSHVSPDTESTSADEFGFVQEDTDSISGDVIPTLDKLATRCVINTHLRALGNRLTTPESFVELLRWWKDRIIESYGLRLADFTVTHREHEHRGAKTGVTEIVYKAQSSSLKDPGYIHFINSKDDTAGVITIVNRDATLQPSMILSRDTRPEDDRFSQSPGIGLGRAILTLILGHSVSCKSGGHNMDFILNNKSELVANTKIMSQEDIIKFRRSSVFKSRRLVPFMPNPATDTIFTIGGGKSSSRNKVSLKEFETWCESASFLQDIKQGGIIKTEMGDLVLDPTFRGKLYLKGFLLSETNKRWFASLSEKRLRYGYNILYGTPDAKKKHMSSLEEECQAIMSIWDLVLKQRPQLVELLSKLLNDWYWGDVELAPQFIKPGTVVCLRDYLLQDTSKWYYPTSARQNPDLDTIIAGLDRQGGELRDSYWSILQRNGMVHTAEVEQQRRFLAAEPTLIPNSQFAKNIYKALQACLYACESTSNLCIMFVRGGGVPLQVVLVKNENVVRIHEKWLYQEEAKHELGLCQDISLPDLTLRTSEALFEQVTDQLHAQLLDDDASEPYDMA